MELFHTLDAQVLSDGICTGNTANTRAIWGGLLWGIMIKYSRYATLEYQKAVKLMHLTMCGEGQVSSSMTDDLRTQGTHHDSLHSFIIRQRECDLRC